MAFHTSSLARGLIAPGLAAIFLAGCGNTSQISQRQMMAPANMELAMRGDVAIVEFTGEGGQQVSDRLAASMERVRVEGRPVFSVSGPIRLHSGRSVAIGNVDPAEALDFARSVDARAVMMGQTAYDSDTEILPTEFIESCVAYDAAGNCLELVVDMRQCVRITVGMEFAAQALDVDTAQPIYEARPGRTQRATTECISTGDNPAVLMSRMLNNDYQRSIDALKDQLAQTAADGIHGDIAPYPQTFQVSFLNEPHDLDGARAGRFEEASDLVDDGHVGTACSVWETMIRSGVDDPALAYNMAACVENDGNYLAALEAYDSVYRRIFHSPHQSTGGDGEYDIDDWARLLDAARARVRRRYEAEEMLVVLTGPPAM